MSHPFKKLYFVWFRFGGGATMGCYQPFLACRDLGIPATVIGEQELYSKINLIKDSAIFIMKRRLNQNVVNMLRNNNNKVVRYTGDGYENLELEYFKNIKNLNGAIVGSESYKTKIKQISPEIPVCVIPANHDMFLDDTLFQKERNKKFKLYFGGSRSSDGLLTQGDLGLKKSFEYSEGYFHSLAYIEKNMKNRPSKEIEDYVLSVASPGKCKMLEKLKLSIENPSRYSCHYAIRAPFSVPSLGGPYQKYMQWNTKTGGKVSTAAASGANIVTSLDPSVRVLIDQNYPYAIDTETQYFKENHDEICKEMVLKAKETFGTKLWQDGLNILKDVKNRTRTHNITIEYVDFITRLYN